MSHDLLSAIGSRLEARLKAPHTGAHPVSKAVAAASRSAPFTLLDDTKSSAFAASGGESAALPPAVTPPIDVGRDAGALGQRLGVVADGPMTIQGVEGDVVLTRYPDRESPLEFARYEDQRDLVARAQAMANAPTPAFTPPVPPDFGVGATFRRKGVSSDAPMTVNRLGDGVVFATYTDDEGTREVAFHPNQLDLVTAAP